MDITTATAEKLSALALEHSPITTEEGWIDCACGWKSNHPRLLSDDEAKQLADPMTNDPADHTGDPDPEHLENPEPQQQHVIALQLSYVQGTQ